MTPQIIYLLLVLAGLLVRAHEHGNLRKGKHNFWISLISLSLSMYILYWGGFFDVILNKF